jgi:integrase
MKASKEHRVPLSDAAVDLLKATTFKDNNLVFPAPRGGQLSDMSLLAVLKRMDHSGLTQHGFRSTFRDWAGETTSINVKLLNMRWHINWLTKQRQLTSEERYGLNGWR